MFAQIPIQTYVRANIDPNLSSRIWQFKATRSKIAVQTDVRNSTDRNLSYSIPYTYVALQLVVAGLVFFYDAIWSTSGCALVAPGLVFCRHRLYKHGFWLRTQNIYDYRLGFSRYSGDYGYVDSDWQDYSYVNSDELRSYANLQRYHGYRAK